MENGNGDYVRLQESVTIGVREESATPKPSSGKSWKRLIKWIVLCLLLGVLLIVSIKWIVPILMREVIVPIIRWQTTTFTPPKLAMVIFASLVIFPVFLLPSTPSMWMAGMTFGYGIGFLLVMAGITIGVSLPFFIGILFHNRINGYLMRHPKEASILKLAGEGSWIHQFEAVVLIRISPFPYPVFNYVVVATDVGYSPYISGSMVGVVPDVLIALYSGILMRSFADASQDPTARSTGQIVFDAVGFCVAVAATVVIGIYTKRRLDQKQRWEPILQ